jgi:hypothetical protein
MPDRRGRLQTAPTFPASAFYQTVSTPSSLGGILMLNNVSEPILHRIRWILVIGWLILIASLLYDPITPAWTDASNLLSPFHVKPEIATDPARCIKIRETCLPETTYAMGALIWWAMVVPSGIFILMVFGHEFWRRICPLSFVSQIPRALGLQRRRWMTDPITGARNPQVVTITETSWLGRNHLYVQFGLFVLGLGLRILFVNSDRIALASFLIGTIFCAILVGYLYAGKSWCQYFCPMAPVQMVYTGPRGLLGSQAHLTPSPAVTQSMCRAVNPATGQEQSACVGCKQPCIDIDSEKTYWAELDKPGRRLVQYGYLGMVIAFYLYYFLYAGNWDYYFTGAWTREADQVARAWDIGFYLYDQAIPIPKAIAVFMTFGVLIAIFVTFGVLLEKLYRLYARNQGQIVSRQQAQHVAFTLFTTASFWTFFAYGARPSLNRLPTWGVLGFNALIVLVGSMWLFRTFGRSHDQYERERLSVSLRKQLQKLDIDPKTLGGRSIEALTPDEIYTLVKVLPNFSQQLRQQSYAEVVADLLSQQVIDVDRSFDFFKKLRQELQVDDSQHFAVIEAIAASQPSVLTSSRDLGGGTAPFAKTVARTIAKTVAKKATKPTIKTTAKATAQNIAKTVSRLRSLH